MAGCNCTDCKCPDESICKAGDCKKSYVVFLTATWCGPCKLMHPIIEKLKAEGYIVYVFDVDRSQADEKLRAQAYPTIVVFDKGKEIKRFVGVTAEFRIKGLLRTRSEQNDYQLGR